MRVAAAVAVFTVVCTLAVSGCGKQEHATPLVQAGVVDASLPPEERARQDALVRLFTTLQSGTAARHLKSYEPDLEFQESEASFVQDGIQLRSWDWIGRTEKDKLRVRMIFLLDEPPGDKTVAYERVYRVTRQGNRFVIRRAE